MRQAESRVAGADSCDVCGCLSGRVAVGDRQTDALNWAAARNENERQGTKQHKRTWIVVSGAAWQQQQKIEILTLKSLAYLSSLDKSSRILETQPDSAMWTPYNGEIVPRH